MQAAVSFQQATAAKTGAARPARRSVRVQVCIPVRHGVIVGECARQRTAVWSHGSGAGDDLARVALWGQPTASIVFMTAPYGRVDRRLAPRCCPGAIGVDSALPSAGAHSRPAKQRSSHVAHVRQPRRAWRGGSSSPTRWR